MTDFDYDVMQKKRIARGAFNRKGTTNRKGCRLPHENLTKKELQKMNSKCAYVNLSKPLDWSGFLDLSTTLQEEYLNHLIETFRIGIGSIEADLFKLPHNKLYRFIEAHNLDIAPTKKGRISNANLKAWREWVGEEDKTAPVTESTYRAETQYTHCEPATSATGSDESTTKPFRAHDFDELFQACGLEQKTENIEPEDEGILYPLTGMNLELKGMPIDILATLRMSFPALLDKDKTYRFQIKADTFTKRWTTEDA